MESDLKPIKLAIDATSIVNTGGFTHLYHLLEAYDDKLHPLIHKIIIYSSKKVLERLPEKEIINKQTHYLLNKSKLHRLFFQTLILDASLKKNKVDFLISLTGDYIGRFRPYVGMSQNMLLYEKEFWGKIKSIKEKGKLRINYLRQKKCFKSASGIIFISNYGRNYITKKLKLEKTPNIIINHGVSPIFFNSKRQIKNFKLKTKIKLIYVSSIHVYKNQCNVIDAVTSLRQDGISLSLTLIGQIIYTPSGKKLLSKIKEKDPNGEFIKYIPEVQYENLPSIYSRHDAAIFASTCENMPNILIESMASRLPIVCSNKEPMPEFLKDGGYYFNATSIDSISQSILRLIEDKDPYVKTKKNFNEVRKLKWEETSKKTFNFTTGLNKIYV